MKTKRLIQISLTDKQIVYLEQLAQIGCYGDTVEEVARWLVQLGISDRLSKVIEARAVRTVRRLTR